MSNITDLTCESTSETSYLTKDIATKTNISWYHSYGAELNSTQHSSTRQYIVNATSARISSGNNAHASYYFDETTVSVSKNNYTEWSLTSHNTGQVTIDTYKTSSTYVNMHSLSTDPNAFTSGVTTYWYGSRQYEYSEPKYWTQSGITVTPIHETITTGTSYLTRSSTSGYSGISSSSFSAWL